LNLVFASCDSPYAVLFQGEHRSFPSGDPQTAALIFPELTDRLSYGAYKSLCPGKPLKSLEKAANLMIGSQFIKNIASEHGIDASSVTISMVSEYLTQVVSDSLAPEALGYEGTKEAMAAAVGTALSSNYSCGSIEAAAKLYDSYGRDDYFSDICNNKNPLKTLLGLLKKATPAAALVAVPTGFEFSEDYVEVYLRDPAVGKSLRDGKINRKKALETLVAKLGDLPICHEITRDYESLLLEMAESGDPNFFALYDALADFKANCPIRFSGYVLDDIQGSTLIFSDGSTTVPLFVVSGENSRRVVEPLPSMNLTLDFSEPLPLKGEDIWIQEESGAPEGARLKFNYLLLIPLVLIALYGWKRDKKD